MRTQLNAAADAAAFAALTPAMMQQSNATAQTAAENMFNGQAAAITSLAAGDTTVTVTVTNPNGNALIRNVTVTYSAQNNNMFAGFLGLPTTSVGGTSSATATTAPNINFYLLLDNSPSMALPSTQAGITQLENLTPQQLDGGCAFACHHTNTNTWVTAGNPCAKTSRGTTKYTTPTLNGSYAPGGNSYCAASQGTQIDNYQLARNNNITLRLDVLSSAVCCSSDSLMYAASNMKTTSPQAVPPIYQFAAYSMDTLWSVPGTTPGADANNNLVMALTSNYMSAWSTASANFGVMKMYDENYLCATSACTSGLMVDTVGDVATNYDVALSSINATMPNPGNGTNVPGDSPQEVLFFVTDGMEDELISGVRVYEQINGPSWSTPNYCTTIKNRGIKIAVLYTTYLALPTSTWYEQNRAVRAGYRSGPSSLRVAGLVRPSRDRRRSWSGPDKSVRDRDPTAAPDQLTPIGIVGAQRRRCKRSEAMQSPQYVGLDRFASSSARRGGSGRQPAPSEDLRSVLRENPYRAQHVTPPPDRPAADPHRKRRQRGIMRHHNEPQRLNKDSG